MFHVVAHATNVKWAAEFVPGHFLSCYRGVEVASTEENMDVCPRGTSTLLADGSNVQCGKMHWTTRQR